MALTPQASNPLGLPTSLLHAWITDSSRNPGAENRHRGAENHIKSPHTTPTEDKMYLTFLVKRIFQNQIEQLYADAESIMLQSDWSSK